MKLWHMLIDTVLQAVGAINTLSNGSNTQIILFFLMKTHDVSSHLKDLSTFFFRREDGNITIHPECPCRIKISHPRGRNFNQGRGLHG